MDWDGKIGTPQTLCAASGRVLAPGEQVYGMLVHSEAGFVRVDVAAEAWDGYDHAAALSWWRRTVPLPEKPRARVRLDPVALARIFSDLADSEDPQSQAFRYIVGLCLLRARKLVLDRIEREADGSSWMVLHERGGLSHRLRDPGLRVEDEAGLTEQLLAVAAAGEAPAGQSA
jgi:hypothetical protein